MNPVFFRKKNNKTVSPSVKWLNGIATLLLACVLLCAGVADTVFAIGVCNSFVSGVAQTGGSISPSTGQTVTCGSSTVFTMTPNSGYYVDYYTIACEDVESMVRTAGGAGRAIPRATTTVNYGQTGSATYTLTTKASTEENCTVTAYFAVIQPKTITATSNLGGTISPSGAVSVSNGANQTFTLTPGIGNGVLKVLVDGSAASFTPASDGTVTYTFSNVTANHTIEVVFQANQTETKTTTVPGTGGTVDVKASVVNNDVVFTKLETVPTPAGSPAFVDTSTKTMPLLSYTLANVPAGQTQVVNFLLPSGVIANRVYKYGKTAADPTDHWYDFTCGTIPCGELGSEEGRTKITLYLIDGALGDSDLTVNGTIDDPVSFTYIADIPETPLVETGEIISVAGSGGTIIPAGDKYYNVGQKVIYKVQHEDGFHIDNITLDGKSLGKVDTYEVTATNPPRLITAAFQNGEVKVNGLHQNLTVNQGEQITMEAAFSNRNLADKEIDMWIAILTPSGWLSYDPATGNWKNGLEPSYKGKAMSLKSSTVFTSSGLSSGTYTFYCGYSIKVTGGALNTDHTVFYDSITVTVK